MSAATRYGDDANLPPPTRVTETPEAEGYPEVEPPLDAAASRAGVAVACGLEEDTMCVTVQLPGRIESISTSVHVPKALQAWQPWPEIVAAADAMLRLVPKPPA